MRRCVGGAGTAVRDAVASCTPPPTHFKRKTRQIYLTREEERVSAGRRGGAGTAVPDTAHSYTRRRGPNQRITAYGGRGERSRLRQTPRHHTLTREGGGGTVVPDTGASYSPPPTQFNPNPRVTCRRTPRVAAAKQRKRG